MTLAALRDSFLAKIAMGAERLVRGKLATSPESLAHCRNFLFLQYQMPLGHCVHDTPIYESLRTCMPDARIAVATRGTGYETLRHNPYIDSLISTADPLLHTIRAAKELRAALSEGTAAPVCGITNCSNPGTRIALLNMLSGRHLRLGHTHARGLYHLPQKYDQSASLIDNNLCLVANFGCAIEHVEPRVFFSDLDVEKVNGLLQMHGIGRDRPLTVFVTQNSGSFPARWPHERFAHVIRHVSHRSQIVFAGILEDDAAIKELRIHTGSLGASRSASFAGLTTIAELSALLCLADYLVTLETGTMHVGRAAGIPMVVMAPSWHKPLEWLPLGRERIRILRGEDIGSIPENYQLDEIEAGAVITALDELMTLYPPSDLERSARVRKSLSTVDHSLDVIAIKSF